MLNMRTLFQKISLVACLLFVIAVFGEVQGFEKALNDKKIFELMGESKTNTKNLRSVEREENKEERPSIKRILVATGAGALVGTGVAALLGEKKIGGSYHDQIETSTVLLGTVLGRLSVEGTKKAFVVGVLGFVAGFEGVRLEGKKEFIEKVFNKIPMINKFTFLNVSPPKLVAYWIGSVVGTGLVEVGIRKWEEYKREKEISQEENLDSKGNDLEKRYYGQLK